MKRRAKRTTFGVTCVVAKIPVAHLVKADEGFAEGVRGFTGGILDVSDSALRMVSMDSNQKKQVIWSHISRATTPPL